MIDNCNHIIFSLGRKKGNEENSKFKDLPFITQIHIILLFISFVNSMYPWYTWNTPISSLTSLFVGIISLFNIYYYRLMTKPIPILFIYLLVAMYLWNNTHYNLTGLVINCLLSLVNLFTIIQYDSNIRKIALRFITNGMAVLIAVSLISYILFLLDLFPFSPSIVKEDARKGYSAYNYYVFIVANLFELDYYARFASIFAEPGHLAMGLTLLIAANKFQISKLPLFIFFVGVLFSFSLAGYITTFLGLILFSISRFKVYNILIVAIIAYAGIFAIEQSGNEKILEVYLYKRINMSEDGSINIKNNRNTYRYNEEFKKICSNPKTFLFGSEDPVDHSGGNAGYKVFMVDNGLLGLLLVFSFFSRSFFIYRKKENIIFFIVLTLLLAQGFYPFRECVLLPYILSQYDSQEINPIRRFEYS